MILFSSSAFMLFASVPRVGGGDPVERRYVQDMELCSPRRRG